MKLFHCNGRILTVRNVSEIIYRVTKHKYPIKPNGYWIEDDDTARNRLRDLLALGHKGEKIE